MSFNREQLEHWQSLASRPPNTLCWCGWYEAGKCPNCKHPDLKGLTAADKIPLMCPECRNAPGTPRMSLTHTIGCSRRTQVT